MTSKDYIDLDKFKGTVVGGNPINWKDFNWGGFLFLWSIIKGF
jgi:hypothetical protein